MRSTDEAPEQQEQAAPADFSLHEVALSLQALHDFDADVVLRVDRVVGGPTDIRDASLAAKVENGQLSVPIAAIVSDVSVEGHLRIQSADDGLGFELALSSEGSEIRNVAKAIEAAKDLEGSFESFTLHATGRGRNLRTALESLDLFLKLDRANLSYGRAGGNKPVPLMLESFEIALPKGEALRLSTRGVLFDEAFSVDLSSATVSEAL